VGLEQLVAALRNPPEVLARLRDIPDLFLVGGYLRDTYWGRPTRDIDLAAPAPLEALLGLIEAKLGVRPFTLNHRFASYRVVVDDYLIDISPLHAGGLMADLGRRDYSINTFAVLVSRLGADLGEEEILVHPDGLLDMDERRLRMVARDNLVEDPLRILRGYRLAATRGLKPDDETRRAWRELAPLIGDCVAERVHEELVRWFGAAEGVPETLAWCGEDGVLWQLFPQLADARSCSQNAFHHLDVWQHTLECLRQLELLRVQLPTELESWRAELDSAWAEQVSGAASAGALTRLALLLHDIGKPATSEEQPDGHISFHQHQELGAEMVAQLLMRLKFATAEIDFVLLMVREHLRLGFYSDHLPLSPRLVYRYICNLGEATPLAVLHALADCAATRGESSAGLWVKHVAAAAEILGHYYARDRIAAPPVLLDGHAIMQLLGIEPGELVGQLKAALLEATAAGEVETTEQAQAFVRSAYKTQLAAESE